MSNKPIAWIDLRCGGIVTFDAVWASKVDDKKPIPLYTHPAELTDEEIKDLYMSMKALDQSNILIRFSRELLRKASEK
jgi:hypothetical protein